MSKQTTPPVFITPASLSERWGGSITEGTLAQWRARKQGPRYHKLGGAVVYKLSDVEAYEAAQKNEVRK